MAWYSRDLAKTGGRKIVFSETQALHPDMPIEVPCGQCVGCRLEKSRQWAMRCMHESKLHDDNCFVTLTLSDEALEKHGWSLNKDYVQKFMKRLRKKYIAKNPYSFKEERENWENWQFKNGVRYYYCGEYTDENKRPHYHILLFNHDFSDKEIFKVENNNPLYTSKELNTLWPFGFSSIGSVTFESAGYVARYCMKKITGSSADNYYTRDTGEIVMPEFNEMSRRPGIGKKWYDKYKTDVYPHDYVVVKETKTRPPKYYDRQLQIDNPDMYEDVKITREINSSKFNPDNTPERLIVREQCKIAQIERLNRNLE